MYYLFRKRDFYNFIDWGIERIVYYQDHKKKKMPEPGFKPRSLWSQSLSFQRAKPIMPLSSPAWIMNKRFTTCYLPITLRVKLVFSCESSETHSWKMNFHISWKGKCIFGSLLSYLFLSITTLLLTHTVFLNFNPFLVLREFDLILWEVLCDDLTVWKWPDLVCGIVKIYNRALSSFNISVRDYF